MGTELLEIEPRELKFEFELKKQSSCLIRLVSNSDQYLAYKVKTTSPKKYCVRPNVGIIKPKATFDFTVTMQAQRVAPPEMQCKDKFLIQSTIVPFGSSEEDITSDMFAKDSGKYIEEKKLRVVLVSPSYSPVLLTFNGTLKQDASYETSIQKEKVPSGIGNIPPPDKVEESRSFKDTKDEELKSPRDMDESKATEDVDSKLNEDVADLKVTKDVVDLKLVKEVDDLKSMLAALKAKLNKAEITITKLTSERSMATQERETLKQELAVLRRKSDDRKDQVGFPFLFVIMVALINLALGYLMHR